MIVHELNGEDSVEIYETHFLIIFSDFHEIP